jgi:pimeloyl-ACP methyl ester carboxylesterase
MRDTIARRASTCLAVARNNLLSEADLRATVAQRTSPAAERTDRPLVLVHGWVARKSCWLDTIVALHNRGLNHLHAASYNVWRHDLATAADLVADRLESVAAAHPDQPVDVLAHSMGGIVTLRAALTRPHLADRLGRVVTMGSPYAGARLARLARIAPYGPLRSAAQMAPGHHPMARMVADAAQRLVVPWASVWSAADELVPERSARALEGDTVTHVRTDPDVGHIEMLACDHLADTLAGLLTPPDDAPAEAVAAPEAA